LKGVDLAKVSGYFLAVRRLLVIRLWTM